MTNPKLTATQRTLLQRWGAKPLGSHEVAGSQTNAANGLVRRGLAHTSYTSRNFRKLVLYQLTEQGIALSEAEAGKAGS